MSVGDGYFGRRGPRGADLWLANVDGEDDVFDSVEIAQGTLEELQVLYKNIAGFVVSLIIKIR